MPQVPTILGALLDQLESVYQGKAWHGPTLRGSLKGIPAQEAGKALTQSGHSIADIALHCAYWKYSVRRRLLNSKRGAFAWKGSNWFTLLKPLTDELWGKILNTLDDEHEELRQAVESFPHAQLGCIPKGSKYSYIQLIQGIAAHDVFHAGQVRLLKVKSGS
jgi:uncharacterized damage-inducible protein DinB